MDRRNGDRKAGLGGREGGDVVRLLVDEPVDPELRVSTVDSIGDIDQATLSPRYAFLVRL